MESKLTRSGIAPALAMQTRFSELRLARSRSSPAADRWSSRLCEDSLRISSTTLACSADEHVEGALLGHNGRSGGSIPLASHHCAMRLRRT